MQLDYTFSHAVSSVLDRFDMPATAFMALLFMGIWVMYRTQANPGNNFDFSDMLRDDNGKPSASRLGFFVCMATATWDLMYMTVHSPTHTVDIQFYVVYTLVFSGVKIAERVVDLAIQKFVGRPPDR